MSNKSDNKAQSIDIGRAFDYVKFALKKGWWILLFGTLFAGLVGYVIALRVPNEFEVRTTFVMDPGLARIEAEKLQSETRLLRTLHSDRKFQMSRRIDLGWRGMNEMYNESPFDIVIGDLPAHMRDIPHKLKLFKDGSFEIELRIGKDRISTKALLGEEIQVSEIPITVSKTKFWHSARSEFEYDVIFWSDEALQRNYSSKLEVIYLVDRPHRIELSFTDENRQRSFDFLETYSKTYVQEQSDLRKSALEELSLNSQAEREVLEGEILQTSFTFSKSAIESAKSDDLRLLNESLEMRFKQIERLETRLTIWEETKKLNPDHADIIQRLKQLGTTDTDSAMLEILNNPKSNMRFAAEYERIKARDQDELQALKGAIGAEQVSSSKFYALRPFLWELALKEIDNENGRKALILWERYHRLNQQIIDSKIEAGKQDNQAVTADPTHFTLGESNSKRKQRALILAFTGFFLSIGICLIYYRNGTLKHLEQLYLLSNLYQVNAWSNAQKEIETRTLFANLDLSLGQKRQIIAVVSHQDAENISAFVKQMGTAFTGFGHQCLYVNMPEMAAQDSLEVPENATSSWWMSNEPKAMIAKASEKYDRIFVILPALTTTPEAKGFLRNADHAYYLLLKKQSHSEDWMAWQEIQKEVQIPNTTFFIG